MGSLTSTANGPTAHASKVPPHAAGCWGIIVLAARTRVAVKATMFLGMALTSTASGPTVRAPKVRLQSLLLLPQGPLLHPVLLQLMLPAQVQPLRTLRAQLQSLPPHPLRPQSRVPQKRAHATGIRGMIVLAATTRNAVTTTMFL